MKNQKKAPPKTIFVTAVVVLAVGVCGGVAYALYRARGGYETPSGLVQINDQIIDFSPGTEADNREIEAQKENGTLNAESSQSGRLSASIARASQDANGTLQVRVTVSGATAGSCQMLLTNIATNDLVKRESPIVNKGTYYACEGFDVPRDNLNNGQWRALITIQSANEQTSTEQEIVVKGI